MCNSYVFQVALCKINLYKQNNAKDAFQSETHITLIIRTKHCEMQTDTKTNTAMTLPAYTEGKTDFFFQKLSNCYMDQFDNPYLYLYSHEMKV